MNVKIVNLYFIFFFFSSRRRHTRWPRDWSSDVCSSDLRIPLTSTYCICESSTNPLSLEEEGQGEGKGSRHRPSQIGRASCRERVEIWERGVATKQKNEELKRDGRRMHDIELNRTSHSAV